GMISDPEALDDQAVLQLATEFEGHPDNAAPALRGGVVLSWMQGATARAVPLHVGGDVLHPVVLLPTPTLSTDQARGLLPEEIPHADAVFNASRSGLLVHALAGAPELLLEATEDRLHQEQRAPGMPESVELMRVLRREGHPAVVSGAGPSVLVMSGRRAELAPLVRRFVGDPTAWRIAEVALRTTPAAPVVG
ncbi:MAG: homoserine kinase, partial [Brachybacterium sp.]|nr:homoserine kinase [Brachybacterium sp.]